MKKPPNKRRREQEILKMNNIKSIIKNKAVTTWENVKDIPRVKMGEPYGQAWEKIKGFINNQEATNINYLELIKAVNFVNSKNHLKLSNDELARLLEALAGEVSGIKTSQQITNGALGQVWKTGELNKGTLTDHSGKLETLKWKQDRQVKELDRQGKEQNRQGLALNRQEWNLQEQGDKIKINSDELDHQAKKLKGLKVSETEQNGKIEKLQDKTAKLEKESGKLAIDNENLAARLDTKDQEIAQVWKWSETSTKQANESTAKIKEQAEKIRELQNIAVLQGENAKRRDEEIASIYKTVGELKQENTRLDEKVGELENKQIASDDKIGKQAEKLETLKNENGKLKTQTIANEREIASNRNLTLWVGIPALVIIALIFIKINIKTIKKVGGKIKKLFNKNKQNHKPTPQAKTKAKPQAKPQANKQRKAAK